MKKFNLIVIGVLASVVLAGGFYLWSQKKTNSTQTGEKKVVVDDSQKQNQQEQNQQQNKNNSSSTEEQIDTSNWKTYRNEELGFEIKYPKDWKIKETTCYPENLVPCVILTNQKQRIDILYSENIKEFSAKIRGLKCYNESRCTIEELAAGCEKFNKINIAGKDAIECHVVNSVLKTAWDEIIVQNIKGNVFEIGVANILDNVVKNRILSTFYFLKK